MNRTMESSLRRLEQHALLLEKYIAAEEHQRAGAELYQLLHLLTRTDGWASISAEWMREFSRSGGKVVSHARALVQHLSGVVSALQQEITQLPAKPAVIIRRVSGYQAALEACRRELPYLLEIAQSSELTRLLLFPIRRLFAELPVAFYFSCIELAFFVLHAGGNGDRALATVPALQAAFDGLEAKDQDAVVMQAEKIRQQILAQAQVLFRFPDVHGPLQAIRALEQERPSRERASIFYAKLLPAAKAELRECSVEPNTDSADFPVFLGTEQLVNEGDALFSRGTSHPSWTCFELAGLCGFPIEEICPSIAALSEEKLLPGLIAHDAARSRISIGGDKRFRLGPVTSLLVSKLLGELRLGLETRHRISALLQQYRRRLLFAPIDSTNETACVQALCAWLVDQGLRPVSTVLPGDETDVQHGDEFVIEAKFIRASDLLSDESAFSKTGSDRLDKAVLQLREYGDRRSIRERYLVLFNSCPGLKLQSPPQIGDDVVVCAIDLGPATPSRLRKGIAWSPTVG